MKGSEGPPGARPLRFLAEDGHPEDTSGQEAGGHDHVELKRGLAPTDRNPSGFLSRIVTWGGGGAGCTLALDWQRRHVGVSSSPTLADWLALSEPQASRLPNASISFRSTAQPLGGGDEAQLCKLHLAQSQGPTNLLSFVHSL